MNPEEYSSISRSMIEHENELLNHRMTWMWTFQGLLMGATAFAWEDSKMLLGIISFIGFTSAISFGLSFVSALRAIKNILTNWDKYSSENPGYEGPSVIGSDRKGGIHTFFKPWGALPWIVAFLWLGIATLKLIPCTS